MSTFKELQQQLVAAKSKAKVYQHLVDHLESTFRPQAGTAAKKVLLTDEKVPVADEYFEQVVKELFSGLESVTNQIIQIEGMSLPAPVSLVSPPGTPNPLAAPPGVVPVNLTGAPVPAPAPVVAPKTDKKSKSTTQGEVQS